MPALSGQVVVVAGGTGDLGRAVVDDLLSRGARVVVGERKPSADGARADVQSRRLDASDEGSVSALFDGLPQAPLAVVNVIGGWAAGPSIEEMELELLRRQIELNLVTATLLTKHAVRRMKPMRVGRIVHVSSRAARESGANAFAYSVAKLGVTRLVEAAAAENLDHGITVNCVLPSTLDTPANRAAMPGADFSRWPKTSEVARVIGFLVSDDAAIISGAAIPVFGRA